MIDDGLGEASDRAGRTLAAIRARRLYVRRHGLFGTRRWWRVRRSYETLWPFADAWSAFCTWTDQESTMQLLDDMPQALRSYAERPGTLAEPESAGFQSVVTPPLGSGGDKYYDDNAWLGLALLRHFELTNSPALLTLARRVYSFVLSGWSTDATWRIPGGIRWKEPASNTSRNTCVNGPAATLAARIHQKTGDGTDLDWAIRIYDWTREALRTPEGLYEDRIASDGRRDPTLWSYNQGSMIGAGVLLARQTRDQTFLEHAVETAAAYLEGRSVSDLLTQDPAFNAVLFRNLLVLDQDRPDPRYRALAAAYGTAMWSTRRLRHGFFSGQGSVLNNTAAMLQIYALLAGASPHP
ncbi:MAG TPA: glycoside hydrolase family 76 protein [Acidimicrobiales bacterium]|nr:glycoside hydrolase family 76 protein [Acidimicrobiales bacterium]